jgi:hypothetical protein
MRVRKRFTFYDEFLEMNMAYHYHFCAVAQVANGGTSYCDGVCVCEKLIRGDDGSYNNLKEQISKQFKEIGDAPIAILSLTLINNE